MAAPPSAVVVWPRLPLAVVVADAIAQWGGRGVGFGAVLRVL